MRNRYQVVTCDSWHAYGAPCKSMYRYVAHVSVIEKSNLDKVLSRKRPRSRWGPPLGALIAGRASSCPPLPTLQVPAETLLASSPCGGCFFLFFFCHFFPNVHSYVWKHISLNKCHVRTYANAGEQMGCCPFELCAWGSRPARDFLGVFGWLFFNVPV